jgi:hypothetical protein
MLKVKKRLLHKKSIDKKNISQFLIIQDSDRCSVRVTKSSVNQVDFFINHHKLSGIRKA